MTFATTDRRPPGRQPRQAARRLAWLLALTLLLGCLWWAWPEPGGPGLPKAAALSPAQAGAASRSTAPRPPAVLAPQALPAAAAGPGDGVDASAAIEPPLAPALVRCQAQAAARRALVKTDTDGVVLMPEDTAIAAANSAAIDSAAAEPLDLVWERLARQLQASPQPRQQAAALLMGWPPAGWQGDRSLAAPVLGSLVTLALSSADATVLLWAVRACDAQPRNPACQGLSARVWTQAEPDNLMAWSVLLHQEPQALDDALLGMAQSRRVDGGWMRLAGVLLAARPTHLSPALRVAFDMRLMGLTAAAPVPPWRAVIEACSDDALADARRRGQCGQIAQLMAEQGRDLLTASLGLSLGKRLGWPADRLPAHQALMKSAGQLGQDWITPGITLDCQAGLLDHQMQQVDRLGETGLLRQVQRAAGRPATP